MLLAPFNQYHITGLSWGCGQLPGWRPKKPKPVYHPGCVLLHSRGWNSNLLRPPKTFQSPLLPAGSWSLHEATLACVRRFRYCRSICFHRAAAVAATALLNFDADYDEALVLLQRWDWGWFQGIFDGEVGRVPEGTTSCCQGKIHIHTHTCTYGRGVSTGTQSSVASRLAWGHSS